jgi:hypothetical protein
VGAGFLDLAVEGGAMRVPNPAAGTMTNTFIGAISIQDLIEVSLLADGEL